MAVAIAATLQDGVYPPRVLVSVTGLAGGELVDIFRVVGADRTSVRGGYGVADDPSFLALDAELPFGVSVSYVADVDGTEYATSGTTYTLPGAKVALTDAITGQAAEVVILSWPSKSFDRESSVFRLANGATAVVQGPMGQFTSTIEVYTEFASSRENLEDLLTYATSGTIQVRQAGPYDDVDCYVTVLSHQQGRWSQDGSDERRIFTLEVAEVLPWSDELEARGYTYADLEAAYSGLTYADLAGDHATYLALAQAELTP